MLGTICRPPEERIQGDAAMFRTFINTFKQSLVKDFTSFQENRKLIS